MTVHVLNLSKQTCNTKMLERKTNHKEIVDLENVIGKHENDKFFIDQTDNNKMLDMKTNQIELVDLENIIGKNENNIFFIESNSKLSKFHPRILCAFESAAIHNPYERV